MRTTSVLSTLAVTAVTAALVTATPAGASPPTEQRTAAGSAASSGLMVFSADATGSDQLYTVGGDGSGLTQITHLEKAGAAQADWAPDGLHIVFELEKATTSRLGVVDFDGANLHLLPRMAPAGGATGQPSYSTDGRTVFFERYDGKADDAIFSATLAGKHLTRLTNPPDGYGDSDPNESPDGTTLSFVRIGPGRTDAALMVMDLSTGKVKQLTPFSEDVAVKVTWAPNSKRLAYSRDAWEPKKGISGNVMSIHPDGTRRHAVTVYSGGKVTAFTGSYSPDGRWIVYREEHTDRWPLMVIRPDGSDAHPILEVDGLRPRGTDWSTGPGVG